MTKFEDLEKLHEDAENHPERGMINGRLVLNDRSEKLEITISRETYKRLLLNAATEGEPPTTAASRLLKTALSLPDERGKVRDFLELKAALFGVSAADIAAKIFGYNKRKVRERKIARKSKGDEE